MESKMTRSMIYDMPQEVGLTALLVKRVEGASDMGNMGTERLVQPTKFEGFGMFLTHSTRASNTTQHQEQFFDSDPTHISIIINQEIAIVHKYIYVLAGLYTLKIKRGECWLCCYGQQFYPKGRERRLELCQQKLVQASSSINPRQTYHFFWILSHLKNPLCLTDVGSLL